MEVHSHEDGGHSDEMEVEETVNGGRPPAELAGPSSLEKCEFCFKALTKQEVLSCKKDHLKTMCDEEG